MAELAIRQTKIPGLLMIDLDFRPDERGWFKENWQRQKLADLGFPQDFVPVQNNISFNNEAGVTRGIHAEPWDKYISLASGKVFVAIVDLRAGDSFGVIETFEMSPELAIYVPRGCGNSYQTLEPNVAYTYLVNEHWSPDAKYTFANLFDAQLNIAWPIPKEKAIFSEKDAAHPAFKDVTPMEI